MRSLRQIIVIAVLFVFLIFLWLYRFEISRFLRTTASDETTRELQALRLENESLKLAITRLGSQPTGLTEEGYVAAEVYSAYPFNDQSRLIINKGAAQGLREGMAVLAGPNILLGRIAGVRENLSEVQTIFDPAWRSSVGIGPARTKALLVGGRPLLDLIVKDNLPAAGEPVINLSADYPYGLALGRISEVKVSETEPWATAGLEIPYHPNLLDRVLVVIDFP